MPVLQGEFVGVLDAEAALLGRIHQKQSAERSECLSAQILLTFLIKKDDALARIGDLGGRNQPGEARANDNDVRIV